MIRLSISKWQRSTLAVMTARLTISSVWGSVGFSACADVAAQRLIASAARVDFFMYWFLVAPLSTVVVLPIDPSSPSPTTAASARPGNSPVWRCARPDPAAPPRPPIGEAGAHAKPAQRGLGELSRPDGRCFRFLTQFVDRVERLDAEKRAISDDIREVYAEMKGRGFDVRAVCQILHGDLEHESVC
jgi:hypothetical protein